MEKSGGCGGDLVLIELLGGIIKSHILINVNIQYLALVCDLLSFSKGDTTLLSMHIIKSEGFTSFRYLET